jgi:hypothetical protein
MKKFERGAGTVRATHPHLQQSESQYSGQEHRRHGGGLSAPGSAIRRIITPARLSSRRMCCKARCAVRSMMGRLMSIMWAIITRNPGSHHGLSENASKTDPAKLLAILVLDTGNMPITTPCAYERYERSFHHA